MGYQNGSAVNTLQSFLIAHPNRNVQLVPTSGYVSIGSATPKTYLDVYNDADVWHLMVGGATKKLLIGGQAASGDVVLQAGAASTVNNALQRDGGNVGIGTSSPDTLLHINKENASSVATISRGGSNIGASTEVGKINFKSDYNGSPIDFGYIQNISNNLGGLRSSINLAVKATSGTIENGLTVYGTNTGPRVGIGTTAPASIFHVASATNPVLRVEDTTNSATVAMYATDSNLFMGAISNHSLAILTNDTPAITIDTSQNATFAGNVTAGDSSTAATIRAHHDDGSYVDHTGYGMVFARNASYLRPNNDGARTMYFGQSSLTWNAIVFDSNSYTFQKDGNTLLEVDSFGQVNFKGYNGADGFTLPNVTEDTGYSNISMGGVGFLYRGARDSYITQNTYYSKVSGSNGWRAKYGGHGGTVITIDHGFTVSTAAAVTNSGDTFSMGTVFDIDSAGFGEFQDGLAVDGGDLVLGKDAYSISASYVGMKTSNMGGSSDYMIISGISDGNTYVSSKSGANTRIRGGGNADAHELIIDANQAEFKGDVRFKYGHIGGGSTSYMMPIGFNRNTADGTIINSSYSAYQLHNYQGNLKLQVYNSAGTFQGQHSFNSDLSTTFAGNVDIYTGAASAEFNIGRNSNERLQIYQDDNNTTLTADNDSDTNGTHNFILNRTFEGTGANNFVVQKDGTAQLTIDTNAAATFAANVDATNFRDKDDTSYSLTPDSTATGQWQVNTPSGNVRIGPANTTYSHFSTDRSRFYMNKQLVVDQGIISSYNEDLRLRRTESNNDSILITDTDISFILDGAEDMRLQNDGDLHVEGDVIAYSTTVSDNRLKDNVLTLENSLDKVSKLRGVEYTWNATSRKGQKDIGVIAQEVEEVIPEIVREKKMSLVDGEKYKTVDYEKLTAVLIEAVKELKEEVEELKNKCNDCTC
jgi:hypothetical protein